jgi:hypothetical protein
MRRFAWAISRGRSGPAARRYCTDLLWRAGRSHGVRRNRRLVWSGAAAVVVACGLLVALVLPGGTGGGPSRRRSSPESGRVVPGVQLWPVSRPVIRACRAAQARASFVVLCPSRLPIATRSMFPWEAPSALAVLTSRKTLDISYAAPVGGLGTFQTLVLDRPERFLHFRGRACDRRPTARRATRASGWPLGDAGPGQRSG